MTPPQVLIRGSGALACVFADRLSTVADVHVLTRWPERADALQSGLTIEEAGHTRQLRCAATTRAADLPSHMDAVILAVKTGTAAEACAELAGVLRDAASSTAVQNGIGALEALERYAPPEATVPSVTYMAATTVAVDRVRVSAVSETVFGRRSENELATKSLLSLFQAAGLPTRITDNWECERWCKLIAATAINGTAAAIGCTVGALRRDRASAALVRAVAAETRSVAVAAGIRFPFDDLDEFIDTRLATSSANLPSMAQDLATNRETEVAFINGAVASLGGDHGVDTPLNWFLANLIEARSRRGCAPTALNGA